MPSRRSCGRSRNLGVRLGRFGAGTWLLLALLFVVRPEYFQIMVFLVVFLLTVNFPVQLGGCVRVLGARATWQDLRLVVRAFDLLLRDALLPLPRVADSFGISCLICHPLLSLELIFFPHLQFVIDIAHTKRETALAPYPTLGWFEYADRASLVMGIRSSWTLVIRVKEHVSVSHIFHVSCR